MGRDPKKRSWNASRNIEPIKRSNMQENDCSNQKGVKLVWSTSTICRHSVGVHRSGVFPNLNWHITTISIHDEVSHFMQDTVCLISYGNKIKEFQTGGKRAMKNRLGKTGKFHWSLSGIQVHKRRLRCKHRLTSI